MGLLAVMNCLSAAGLFYDHKYREGTFSLVMGIFVISILVWDLFHTHRHAARVRVIQADLELHELRVAGVTTAGMAQLTPDQKAAIDLKAKQMLDRVARMVGARRADSEAPSLTPPVYALTVRGIQFYVDTGYVMKEIRRHDAGTIAEATCYQLLNPIPRLERIAIALLRLKNSPEDFETLNGDRGHWIR